MICEASLIARGLMRPRHDRRIALLIQASASPAARSAP
ncbi:Hypothetical protein A7982_00657 [Minicystis rosea]|nr:Hypothetical protein A7982_00657 [Minicystis rosea]